MVLVGDVTDKTAIIVDDMADTCGTLVKAADVVMQHGAKKALAIVTHGILSGNAIEALNNGKLEKLVVTNTVRHEEKKVLCPKLETIDISPTVCYLMKSCLCFSFSIPAALMAYSIQQLAEACRRTHNGESVSFLFKYAPVD